MSTTTIIKAESALAKSERELAGAMQAAFESVVLQGEILERIKNERQFKELGFDSFDQYLNERMPLGIKRAYAWKLIAAKNVRRLLPDLDSTSVESGTWTEAAIRPLTHSDFSPNDQKRLGKKIATRVKNGEKLTAALVKSICDDDRGVERKKAEKQAQEFEGVLSPAGVVTKLRGEILAWKAALNKMPGEFWSDAMADDPDCFDELSGIVSSVAAQMKRFANRLSDAESTPRIKRESLLTDAERELDFQALELLVSAPSMISVIEHAMAYVFGVDTGQTLRDISNGQAMPVVNSVGIVSKALSGMSEDEITQVYEQCKTMLNKRTNN